MVMSNYRIECSDRSCKYNREGHICNAFIVHISQVVDMTGQRTNSACQTYEKKEAGLGEQHTT